MRNATQAKSSDQDLADKLRERLLGRVCVVGVGNRWRGDDGVGPSVIDARDGEAPGVWIDAGVAPENHLERIARPDPDTVLIVDAVDFGGSPGECRLIEPAALDNVVISTHAGSLSMISDYLRARCSARVDVIGIQPERIDPREGLSESVARSAEKLAGMLSDLMSQARTP